MESERTFAKWLEQRIDSGLSFVLTVEAMDSDGTYHRSDWTIDAPSQRFAARQLCYSLMVLDEYERI